MRQVRFGVRDERIWHWELGDGWEGVWVEMRMWD